MLSGLLVLALLLLLSAVVLAVVARRRPTPARDDTLRAGQGPSPTAADVALRAGGLTAWMRAGGGDGG